MDALPAASASPLVAEWACNCRVPPPPDLLDLDTARRVAAQERVAADVVATISAALDLAAPGPEHRPRVCPPGWWRSSVQMADCSPFGRLVLMAAGTEGVPLEYRAGPGRDHRASGVNAAAWAHLVTHESAHGAHFATMGLDAAAAALTDPARRLGDEPPGFAPFVRGLHERMTGRPLPSHYDARRWPLRAPGLADWLGGIVAAVAPHAVVRRLGRRVTDDEWRPAWAQEAYRDHVEGERIAAAAAAFRPARREPAA